MLSNPVSYSQELRLLRLAFPRPRLLTGRHRVPARRANLILDATDTGGGPRDALARLVGSSWPIVHQFRNILLAAQRELPAERIRCVHDPILRRVQSLIGRGQRDGAFRTDLPRQWLVTTAFRLLRAAGEDAGAGRRN